MRVTILGAGGFLGRKLANRLAGEGAELTLFDLTPPPVPEGNGAISIGGDIATLPVAAIPPGTDVVFHLAAVVSSAAEADYALGRRVNIHGTEAVIDACAALDRPPRVVFTSSVASFSARPGQVLDDESRQIPAGTYGAQKAAAELFLADASRRGMLDAVCLRLPTILVRPGLPNRAASSFVSGIVREPLLGEPSVLPVADDVALWIASPSPRPRMADACGGDGHRKARARPVAEPAGAECHAGRHSRRTRDGVARRLVAGAARARSGDRADRRELARRVHGDPGPGARIYGAGAATGPRARLHRRRFARHAGDAGGIAKGLAPNAP